MKIIIIGAGFTGVQLAKRLIAERNDVVLIDSAEETVRHASNRLDCMVVQANGNSLEVLEEAGIAKADALVTLTESDELNMITCSMVDSVYPNVLKIARVRNYDYYHNIQSKTSSQQKKSQRPLYGIDHMVHPDVEAASAIVAAVEHGAVTDVIDFENSPYELTKITVQAGSLLDGMSVQNIRQMTQTLFLLAFVETADKAYMPTGATVLHADDRLGIITTKETLPEFLTLCGSKLFDIKKIALVGAGRIGTIIAEKIIINTQPSLVSRFFGLHKRVSKDFVIVDSDEKRAKEAAAKFPAANVCCADITDESFIEEEGLKKFDLVITATHNHELNMVTSAYLKSIGVARTVCLVTSESYASIARNIGVDVAVPIKDAVVDSIISHLRGTGVCEIHSVSDGDLEIAEIEIPEDAKVSGKTLMDISAADQFLVLLIKRSDSAEYVIASGKTKILPHDKVILICNTAEVRKIFEIFGVTA